MRAFVSLEVSADVVDSLTRFQQEISSTGADLKLVERENLHFTVKFLGEITEQQSSEAASRLRQLSLGGGSAMVKGAGAFPSEARPRVVWAGVASEDEKSVATIAAEVIGVLDGIGERDDRPFRAHITLGRVRTGRNLRQLVSLLTANSEMSFGVSRLSELRLKSSVLTPKGPVYTDVGVFPLG